MSNSIYSYLVGYCFGGAFGCLVFFRVVGPALDAMLPYGRGLSDICCFLTVLLWAKLGEQVDALARKEEDPPYGRAFVLYIIGFFAGDTLYRVFLEPSFQEARTNVAITTIAYWLIIIGVGKAIDWGVAFRVACKQSENSKPSNDGNKPTAEQNNNQTATSE